MWLPNDHYQKEQVVFDRRTGPLKSITTGIQIESRLLNALA